MKKSIFLLSSIYIIVLLGAALFMPLGALGDDGFLISNINTGQPAYFVNKGPIKSVVDSVVCGETYTFDVSNYSGKRVWVVQQKEYGATTFNGFMTVPTVPYASICNKDEGKYSVSVYTDDPRNNTASSELIGSTQFIVRPAVFAETTTLASVAPGVFVLKTGKDRQDIQNGFFDGNLAGHDFLKQYEDQMDVIALVPTPSLINAINIYPCNCAWGVRKLVDGINYDRLSSQSSLDPENTPIHRVMSREGRFYSFALVPALNYVGGDTNTFDSALYILLHEIGHAWSSFLSGSPGWGSNPLKILEEGQYAHWGYVSDNFDSIMAYGPSRLTDQGGGVFIPTWKAIRETVFNDFDLYAMGLLPQDSVRPTFSVVNFFSDALSSNYAVRGFKKEVTINDIVKIDGKRVPSYGISKNNQTNEVRVTFLIVQGPGGTERELEEIREKVSEIIYALPARWSGATRGLSTISVFTPREKIMGMGIRLVDEEFSVQQLRQETQDILRKTHDDSVSLRRTTDQQKNDFGRTLGLRVSPQVSVSISPMTSAQSLTERLRGILLRLTTLQTELLDLIGRRALLGGS